MAFDFSSSWNPASNTRQAPWGSYAQRFAGDKYGDLAKAWDSSSNITSGTGQGVNSNEDVTLVYNQPSQVIQSSENPWNKVIGAAASIGMGALSGGFGGSAGGGGGGGLGANFNSAGAAPTGISWGDAVNYKHSF